jgi:aspartyl-tRNA synthetase
MIERKLMETLKSSTGKKVKVCGFVDIIRDQKKMQFLVLRDHTGKVQAVNTKKGDEKSQLISNITPESTVTICGTVVEAPQVKLGGIEIQIDTIDVSSIAESPLPLATDSALDLQIDWRQVSLIFSSVPSICSP